MRGFVLQMHVPGNGFLLNTSYVILRILNRLLTNSVAQPVATPYANSDYCIKCIEHPHYSPTTKLTMRPGT